MLNLKNFSPCLLLAMPQLRDPNFIRTVVLLAEFRPEGAFGLVINRPLQLTFDAVQSAEVRIAERYRTAQLWFGGPVNNQQVLLLSTLQPGTTVQFARGEDVVGSVETSRRELAVMPLGEEVALANAKALLADRASDALGGPFKVVVGYAAWAAQQLDQELGVGAWLVVPLSRDLIFSEPKTMWERAVASLGVDPATLQVPPTAVRH